MLKRFVCYGETVISVNDHETHYISARRVADLHGVNPRECIFVDGPRDEQGLSIEGLLVLRPHDEVYIPVSELERRQYPTKQSHVPADPLPEVQPPRLSPRRLRALRLRPSSRRHSQER